MDKLISINKFAKLLGVSSLTLRNWDKTGKLHPSHITEKGYRYYSESQIEDAWNVRAEKYQKITVGYCREYGRSRLEMQMLAIQNAEKGNPVEFIVDRGKEKSLQRLVDLILRKRVKRVVFYNKRAFSSDFALLEMIAGFNDCEIVVLTEGKNGDNS